MSDKPLVSVIIRTYNEERWIGACLDAVYGQNYENFEVIVVDNDSQDATREIVMRYPAKLVDYTGKFMPGQAINEGIRASSGRLLSILSGHCIPKNRIWLECLVRNFQDTNVAGVYGRQEPLSFTSDRDKRDLWNTFQLDRKVQYKDTFFHNANSAIRRDLWELVPFDEEITNIEDRIWAKQILEKNYCLVYEPDASVYHWHGIHQNDNEIRRKNVVRIIQDRNLISLSQEQPQSDTTEKHEICAVIPSRGKQLLVNGKPLLAYTIEGAKASSWINRIIVSTDNEETKEVALSLGAEVPFLRPQRLSADYVSVEQVLNYTVQELNETGYRPDVVALLKPTHPFRKNGFIDELIKYLIDHKKDHVVAAHKNYTTLYKSVDGVLENLAGTGESASLGNPFYECNKGLGEVFRGQMFEEFSWLMAHETGVFPIEDQLARVLIRNEKEADQFGSLLEEFLENEKK